MIGNDVIDLTDPGAAGKSRDRRFMERVFTPRERRAILDHEERDLCLWSLWAGKEASYKALRKLHHSLTAVPKRYEIALLPTAGVWPTGGIAHTPRGPILLSFSGGNGYVHCIAGTEDASMDGVIWDVLETDREEASPKAQSMRVRSMVIHAAARCLNESPEAMEIIRTRERRGLGPPMLYVKNRKSDIDLSMSHDGRFVAWALQEQE